MTRFKKGKMEFLASRFACIHIHIFLGSESSMIYVLDPEAFTILDSMVVPAPPAHLAVTGLYDVDYRIVVACR